MKKIIIGLVIVSMLAVVGCSSDDFATKADLEALSNDAVQMADLEALAGENAALLERIVVLEDTNAVEKVAYNLFIQTDNMDWDALVNDVFTETVFFDMTSVGGSAGEVSSQDIVDGWDQGFMAIESVHHQSGNMQIEVEGDRATVFQYGTATQYATTESGNNTRTFIGTYNIGLVKNDGVWKVDTFGFNLKIMDGNIAFE